MQNGIPNQLPCTSDQNEQAEVLKYIECCEDKRRKALREQTPEIKQILEKFAEEKGLKCGKKRHFLLRLVWGISNPKKMNSYHKNLGRAVPVDKNKSMG